MLMTKYERMFTILFVFAVLRNMLACCPGLCHLHLGTKAEAVAIAYDTQAHVIQKRDLVSKHLLMTSNWNDFMHMYFTDQSKLHG